MFNGDMHVVDNNHKHMKHRWQGMPNGDMYVPYNKDTPVEERFAQRGAHLAKQGTDLAKQGTHLAKQGTDLAKLGSHLAKQGTHKYGFQTRHDS
eukprot:147279-Amorphochlora_amoeboformis.AAC.1